MLTLPKTEQRAAQPYIYVPFTVTMQQMQTVSYTHLTLPTTERV